MLHNEKWESVGTRLRLKQQHFLFPFSFAHHWRFRSGTAKPTAQPQAVEIRLTLATFFRNFICSRSLSLHVLNYPRLALPFVLDRKWIKKALLSERSEFQSFPIFCPAQMGTRRAVTVASPFFAYFLWRSKESEWLPGHTRPANDGNG